MRFLAFAFLALSNLAVANPASAQPAVPQLVALARGSSTIISAALRMETMRRGMHMKRRNRRSGMHNGNWRLYYRDF